MTFARSNVLAVLAVLLRAANQVVVNLSGDRTFCAGVDGTDEGAGRGT